MAKVTTVGKSMKEQTCSKCGDAIPKGSAYRHATPGFRGRKIVRCLKSECSFRPSELTTSKLSGVYAAQEYGHDQVHEWDPDDSDMTADALGQILESAATDVRAVAEEYREASQNWGDQGNEEWDSLADEIDGYADTLESVDFDEFDPEGEQDHDEWIEEQKQLAFDALDECSV